MILDEAVVAMSGKLRIVRVFVASPSDVQRERDSLLGVINELNRTCDSLLGQSVIRLELVRWETDTFPDVGRTQALITEQIGDYDIFIGVLWKRLGTPTGKAPSGTIEEFDTAYSRRNETGKPHIAFYFNRAASPPPQSVTDAEQLLGVLRFRERLASIAFTADYDGAALFADTVRPHLTRIIGGILRNESGVLADPNEQKTAVGEPLDRSTTAGRTVTLVAIGPQDACYGQRSKYLGRSGVVIEAERRDDWLRGTFCFDAPLFPGDDRIYSFLQFRVEPSA